MSGILQFVILFGLFTVVWFCGYFRGKTIKERELKDMEKPEEPLKKARFEEFASIMDDIMTED